jgi:hypothetical protein
MLRIGKWRAESSYDGILYTRGECRRQEGGRGREREVREKSREKHETLNRKAECQDPRCRRQDA